MGLVRANWHLTVTGTQVEHGDLFGEELDRLQGPPDPHVRLRDLILQEADLDRAGITCHLKDEDWSHPSCSTCPERGDAERAPLCRVGLAQEKVLASP